MDYLRHRIDMVFIEEEGAYSLRSRRDGFKVGVLGGSN